MSRVRGIASLLLLATVVTASPAFAQSGGGQVADLADQMKNQDVFCNGTYALCIKAPCSAIPTIDRLGNYAVDYALCSCDLEKGWSMGPGACTDRTPVKKKDGRTYLISTYSNLFNATEKTLSCPKNTLWAWCYGAPCVVDQKAPNKAVCTCPVMQSAAKTLGGNCQQSACSGIWSAATPAGDAFANEHFYSTVKKQDPKAPVNPAAASCTAKAGSSGG